MRDELQELLGQNLVDLSVDSGILQVATNIDKKEQQLQEDLIKQTIELQDFYEDDLSQYTEDDIKAAIASELHSLSKKNIYGEVDIDSLTPEQQRQVIKTRWVIGPRPSSTSVDDIDIPAGPLKARFVAKGYSQYISDHIKETFAATPSSTSLRTLLLHAVLHQYQVTSYVTFSSAFLNTPIEEDIYVQPPPEVYQHRPRVLWKLHRALYGLRTSPKMWQEHLHSTLQGLQLQQLKSDRCVWVKPNLMVLAYVSERLAHRRNIKFSETSLFLEQLRQSFSLKHSTVLTTQQPLRFLGKRICRHPNGDITINLERSYYYSKAHGPRDNINPTSTPSLRRPPVQQDTPLDHLTSTALLECSSGHRSRPPIQSNGPHQTPCITIRVGLVTSETYTSVHQLGGHFTTSSSSHLDYLKDIHYHFDISFPLHINTYCDSDWATDIESRKSTSGTVTSVLGVPLAFNSRTQSTVATSSAEAELYAIGLGISDSLHIYQLLQRTSTTSATTNVRLRQHRDSVQPRQLFQYITDH